MVTGYTEGYTSVGHSPDLARILALPRRRLDSAHAAWLAERLTPKLAKRPGVFLRPWQAQALYEIATCRGAFLGMPVGLGKTLLSLLTPFVLGSKRPWLIIPGGQRDKTARDFRALMADWVVPNPPPVVHSFEELHNVDAVDLLEAEAPDSIFIDEGDKLRSWDIAVTNRIGRYRNQNQDCPIIVATGTPGRNSIRDYSHLMVWALMGGAPVPIDPDELQAWADALDEKPRGMRNGLGALTQLGGGDLTSVRRAYHQRLAETPGVIIVDDTECDVPLTIRQVAAPVDPVLEGHFKVFRTLERTPDGWDTSDAFSKIRHANELGSGIYYRWNPRPPQYFIDSRRAFCTLVRNQIELTRDGVNPLDTTAAVTNAFRKHPVVTAWQEAKKRFIPSTEVVWLSGSVVYTAAQWLAQHPTGLVMAEHVSVGEAIAEVAQLPYFGQGGKDRSGRSIEHHTGAAVLSLHANKRGRNLQHHHHEILVIGWPSAARDVEQFIGRVHRYGQTKPVLVEVLVTCRDTLEAFAKSEAEARFVQSTLGLTQKLLRAQIERLTFDPLHDKTFRFGENHR